MKPVLRHSVLIHSNRWILRANLILSNILSNIFVTFLIVIQAKSSSDDVSLFVFEYRSELYSSRGLQ